MCTYVECRDYLAVPSTKGLLAVPLVAGNRILKSPLNDHRIEILGYYQFMDENVACFNPITISVENL